MMMTATPKSAPEGIEPLVNSSIKEEGLAGTIVNKTELYTKDRTPKNIPIMMLLDIDGGDIDGGDIDGGDIDGGDIDGGDIDGGVLFNNPVKYMPESANKKETIKIGMHKNKRILYGVSNISSSKGMFIKIDNLKAFFLYPGL